MNAIVPLVRSGIFQREEMIASAKEIQNEYIKQKIEPAYIKLSKVRQIMQMENSDIDKIISDVIEEAKKGSYVLYEYPEIFYTIENVLQFSSYSKSGLVDEFKKGVVISKEHSPYYYNLKMHYRFDKVSSDLKSMLEFTFEQNESIKRASDNEIALKIVQSLEPYDKTKFQEIFSNNDTLQSDVFNLINPKIFYDTFIKLSNADKFEFYQTFVKISNDYLNSASHKNDIIFFSSLKDLFDSTTEASISKQHCIWMSDRLKEIVDRISM
jgi:hypothetical protein